MERKVKVNSSINSLDELLNLFKNDSTYKCSKEFDIWEMRTDINGQMEECIVVKKSNMHAIKLFFINENMVKISYIIPNKILNVYFGKSVEARRNIIEIITGKIKEAILAGPPKKAFEELEQKISKMIS